MESLNRLNQKSWKRYFRWALLSVAAGILSGIASAIFLISLELVTSTRISHLEIIWFLPVIGLIIGWVYHHLGKDVVAGNNLILDEIHDPKKVVPVKMAPFILVGTLLTHLFGGSAGREGTAVQMGASLSDQLSKLFHVTPEERKILLVAGAGAGFGSAIGAPIAGIIFGMEVIRVGKLKLFAWFECTIASFVGFYTTLLLGAHHSQYPQFEIPGFEIKTLFFVALAGILFGLTAKVFTLITHMIEKVQSRFISYPPLKPFLAGLLLVLLYHWEGSYRYAGLGISSIQEALLQVDSFRDPVLKTFFTSLTVGSGFKGGEFIPLVFIGTTLGSALSVLLPVSFQLLAGLGFAAVFGGAANTPIACSVMAMEIFGFQIAPYSIVACFMSYYFSGHQGIYKSQKIHRKKHHAVLGGFRWLGELPRRFH